MDASENLAALKRSFPCSLAFATSLTLFKTIPISAFPGSRSLAFSAAATAVSNLHGPIITFSANLILTQHHGKLGIISSLDNHTSPMPCQPALEQYVRMTQRASLRVLLLSMMRAMHRPISANLQESTQPPPACGGGEVLLTSRQEAAWKAQCQYKFHYQNNIATLPELHQNINHEEAITN
jgi:hypothetical protein